MKKTQSISSSDVFDVTGMSIEELREGFGEFKEATEALEQAWDDLVESYPQQWIAFHDRKVALHADSLDEMILMIDENDLPQEKVIVRYVETKPTTLIL